MSDESIRQNPFTDDDTQKGKGADKPASEPLIGRVIFDEIKPFAAFDAAAATDKKAVQTVVRVAERSAEKAERPVESPAASQVDTGSIYKTKQAITEAKQLERALVANCFIQQADGSFKARDDKELVSDGNGGKVTVEALRAHLLTRISERYETAVSIADGAMKDPELVVGAIISNTKERESLTKRIDNTKAELKAQGIEAGVGTYLDRSLIERYISEHKDLSSVQKQNLSQLAKDLDRKLELEARHGELVVTQEMPETARRVYAEMLSNTGLAGAAKRFNDEADKISAEMKTVSGRSEYAKRLREQLRERLDGSIEQSIQDKFVNNPNNPYKLIETAEAKLKAKDLDGARADMEKARELANKGAFPDLEKDTQALQKRAEQVIKEGEALKKLAAEGKATPYELMLQQEKELRLRREGELLDAMRFAGPKGMIDIKYADFLLHADKNMDSESNRKYARDILMAVRFDSEVGKFAAMANPEQFDKAFDKATNGSVDNRAAQKSFDAMMLEYNKTLRKIEFANKSDEELAELEKQGKISAQERKEYAAQGKLSDGQLGQLAQEARSKAEEAAKFAAKFNRGAAHENQELIKQQLKKQIDAELAKPAAEQDKGKVRMMEAVMKPAHQLNAQDKEILNNLLECMKDPAHADKSKVAKIENMVKDKSAIFDAINSFALLQQYESQKQALNQARLAMFSIDSSSGKSENNPLVAEMENDRYGAAFIATLDAVPGQDGRSAWGDIKEAARERGMGEKIWNWSKGFLKELSIAVVSWGAGALAALGVGALTSLSGPGAIVAGGAAGFAAGAGAGHLMRKYVYGESDKKFFSVDTVLDGLSGATGGVAGTSYAVFRGAGQSAMKNVIAQQAGRGVTIGANETFAAFKAAGMADKVRIAAGATPFRAAFTSSMLASATYRYPAEFLSGNHDSVGSWLGTSTLKLATTDAFTNLMGARIVSGVAGRLDPVMKIPGMSNMTVRPYYIAGVGQSSMNFLFNSTASGSMGNPLIPRPRETELNQFMFQGVRGADKYIFGPTEKKE